MKREDEDEARGEVRREAWKKENGKRVTFEFP